MIVSIEKNGQLKLLEQSDFKHFSILDSDGQINSSTEFSDIAEPSEDNHYWLKAESIIRLSNDRDDPEWVENFWGMLKAVEAYGYSDIENKRIKAHLTTDKK
jgi:hypothetical protein